MIRFNAQGVFEIIKKAHLKEFKLQKVLLN